MIRNASKKLSQSRYLFPIMLICNRLAASHCHDYLTLSILSWTLKVTCNFSKQLMVRRSEVANLADQTNLNLLSGLRTRDPAVTQYCVVFSFSFLFPQEVVRMRCELVVSCFAGLVNTSGL